jgi:hypothetical protein
MAQLLGPDHELLKLGPPSSYDPVFKAQWEALIAKIPAQGKR